MVNIRQEIAEEIDSVAHNSPALPSVPLEIDDSPALLSVPQETIVVDTPNSALPLAPLSVPSSPALPSVPLEINDSPAIPVVDTRPIWPGRPEHIYKQYLAEKEAWLATHPTVRLANYRKARGLPLYSIKRCKEQNRYLPF